MICHGVRGAARRLTMTAVVALLCMASWMPARADYPANPSDETLSSRASNFACQLYDVVRERVIEPASQAANAALASPAFDQAYRQFRETMRSTAATVDENVLHPLSQAASDALSSPTADQARAIAGSAWDGVVTGVQQYVVNPFNQWLAPPIGDGSTLEPDNGARKITAALTADATDGVSDPFETVNRAVFAFNRDLRLHLLDPVTQFYHGQTPPAVQQVAQNFFSNLREPITIVSSLLEGNLDDAGNATARFGINTTEGILGFFDAATADGFPARTHNLEEALCVYRLPSGPYIVLPIYGPATVRDAVGRLATVAAYFEVMGVGVYVPYRLGDAVAQSAAWRNKSGAAADTPPVNDSYLTQKLAYFAAKDADCGGLMRNGTDKFGP